MITSYHVHSNISDGNNTISELVEAAARQGLDEIGISDHYVLLSEGRSASWSMPLDYIPAYLDAIESAARAARGKVAVRRGLEVDFCPDSIDSVAKLIHNYGFDYVIGSVHFVGSFPIDDCKAYWDELPDGKADEIIQRYWENIRLMAESRVFRVAGHLDLYKKFGYLPSFDARPLIAKALDAIADFGMAVELNTSGWHKAAVKEPYPSLGILRDCAARDIPIIITADAHNVNELTRDYDRARILVESVGGRLIDRVGP
jgi:histidinol-phosphatase (PHP family)